MIHVFFVQVCEERAQGAGCAAGSGAERERGATTLDVSLLRHSTQTCKKQHRMGVISCPCFFYNRCLFKLNDLPVYCSFTYEVAAVFVLKETDGLEDCAEYDGIFCPDEHECMP